MLVKQRDNEIAILVNYLNKKKEAGGDAGVPVHRNPDDSYQQLNTTSNSSQQHNRSSTQEEQKDQPTLYQMMKGQASPRQGQ